jgi:sugar lactone lactonase YvrE
MRRSLLTCALLAAVTTSACGRVGSVPTAGAGRVKEVLHSAAESRHDGSIFGGLVVKPDGTVFLGAADGDFMRPENVRILKIRRGREPEIFASAKQLEAAGVEQIEPRLMALGHRGELLVVGSNEQAFSVIGIDSTGKAQVVASLSVERRLVYHLTFAALAADPRDGTLYLADRCRIYRAVPGGQFELFAGDRGPAGYCATRAEGERLLRNFFDINGLMIDPRTGALYVGDYARVYRIDGSGVIAIAGRAGGGERGQPGFSGDGGPAADARLDHPGGMAIDPAGELYIADLNNRRVRKIDRSGNITTAIGNGNFRRPYEGPATDVAVDATQLAIDAQSHLWATAYSTGSPEDLWSERLVVASVGRS